MFTGLIGIKCWHACKRLPSLPFTHINVQLHWQSLSTLPAFDHTLHNCYSNFPGKNEKGREKNNHYLSLTSNNCFFGDTDWISVHKRYIPVYCMKNMYIKCILTVFAKKIHGNIMVCYYSYNQPGSSESTVLSVAG